MRWTHIAECVSFMDTIGSRCWESLTKNGEQVSLYETCYSKMSIAQKCAKPNFVGSRKRVRTKAAP